MIEVPLRTREEGKIDPAIAAKRTALVATKASRTVMKSRDDWPVAALYCIKMKEEMRRLFLQDYRWLGARVQ